MPRWRHRPGGFGYPNQNGSYGDWHMRGYGMYRGGLFLLFLSVLFALLQLLVILSIAAVRGLGTLLRTGRTRRTAEQNRGQYRTVDSTARPANDTLPGGARKYQPEVRNRR